MHVVLRKALLFLKEALAGKLPAYLRCYKHLFRSEVLSNKAAFGIPDCKAPAASLFRNTGACRSWPLYVVFRAGRSWPLCVESSLFCTSDYWFCHAGIPG